MEKEKDYIFFAMEERKENSFFKLLFLIFLLISAIFFFYKKNIWGGGVTILILILILFFPKKQRHFYIKKDGIQINKDFFGWKDLDSFFIFEDPNELCFKTKKSFLPTFSLFLSKKDIEKAEEILLNYLPKKKMERSLLNIFSRMIGF